MPFAKLMVLVSSCEPGLFSSLVFGELHFTDKDSTSRI
jgi:hypothetical protein